MDKTERIQNYILRLNQNEENLTELFNEFKDDLLSVSTTEAFDIFRKLQRENYTEIEILVFLDKLVHIFYTNLKQQRPKYENNHPFIYELVKENRLLEEKFDQMREIITQLENLENRKKMIELLVELKDFYPHYEKKENLLFPALERRHDRYEGLRIMWALHNEIKNEIDESIQLCQSDSATPQDMIEKISQLFFDMLGLILKEENILFAAALDELSQEQLDALSHQSLEYPGVFNTRQAQIAQDEHSHVTFENDLIVMPTGSLRLEEVLMIFDTLEIDMTYVDENNKVRYFTRPKDRIFPRSKAVIGRDVTNCHPPQSLDVVLEIIEKFKNNEQDKASFWIDFKDRKILIEYLALRDSQQKYRGVLEVSSDITNVLKIKGQQRLAQYTTNK